MTLAKCSLILGSKSAPTDEEYYILKETLIKSFKDFSPEEIVDAFDKLVAGKLNVEPDKYGKITAAYLGQVLIAHRELRNKALAEQQKKQARIEIDKEPTQQEKESIRVEFLEKCLFKPYRNIKETGIFDVDKVVAATLFKLFRRKKIVDVSVKECDQWESLAEIDLYEDAKKDHNAHKPILTHINRLKEMGKGKDDKMQHKVTERACALFMYDYILKLHTNNRDINEIAKGL